MSNAQLITTIFNLTAVKIIIKKDKNTVKGSFKRSKFVQVTYNAKTDSFDLYAFRVIGVEIKSEKRENDVFLENLKETIELLAA